MKNKGQFFIMSIVLIALAIFILIAFYLTIDETTAIRSASSSRIQIKNIQNIIDDPDNCQGNVTLCDHFRDIYGGKVQLTCSELGEGAPFNYSVTFNSPDIDFATTLTQDIICVGGGGGATCNNGEIEGGEQCESDLTEACTAEGFEDYFKGAYLGGEGACSAMVACSNDCSECIPSEVCGGGGAGG
jgi:hypothetical protein